MNENVLWWMVLVATIICMLALPGLIQMLIEELKKRNKDE